jgi:dTMP kinase
VAGTPTIGNEKKPAGIAWELAERLRGEGFSLPKPKRGVLVAVEGIDGAGISTTAETLVWTLNYLYGGKVAVYTKEPTYGPLGFVAWQAMSNLYGEEFKHPAIMALLFAADRLWHLIGEQLNGGACRGVLRCLAQGYIVVTDRYKYSSIAYQQVDYHTSTHLFQGAGRAWLEEVNAYAPPPHLLVYIDVPVEVALERIAGERWSIQLYEKRSYLERVRANFEAIIASLREKPEIVTPAPEPPEGKPWARLVRELTPINPEDLYPQSPGRYPQLVRIDGTKPLETNIRELIDRLGMLLKGV